MSIQVPTTNHQQQHAAGRRRVASVGPSLVVLSLLLSGRGVEAWVGPTPIRSRRTLSSATQLSMVGFVRDDSLMNPPTSSSSSSSSAYNSNSRTTPLSASWIATDTKDAAAVYPSSAAPAPSLTNLQETGGTLAQWGAVVSAALLVTGNTFGAGSLVLPELARQPGLGPSTGMFLLAYGMNLVSGLCLAEVAITQKEQADAASVSGESNDVPSSFKEFVQENMQSEQLAIIISGISFVVNALVFCFDMSRVGLMLGGRELPLVGYTDASTAMLGWAAGLTLLLTTQSQERISQVASLCVSVLFASFGSLLIPGLAHVWTNPETSMAAVFTTPGVHETFSPAWTSSMAAMTPVIVMALVYQNIVPTVTKLLNYQRTPTRVALALGSCLPLLMYVAWCFACLGGGIDLSSLVANVDGGVGMNPLLTVFSLATLAGSSIGCGLSCASEADIFVQGNNNNNNNPATLGKESLEFSTMAVDDASATEQQASDEFHWMSVAASVGLPLGLNIWLGQQQGADLTGALTLAGGLGSPLLYGIIPVLMAWKQRQVKQQQDVVVNNNNSPGRADFSTSLVGLGVLTCGSTGMLVNSVWEQVEHVLSAM